MSTRPPDGDPLALLCCQGGDIFKHEGWQKLKPAFEKDTLHFIGLLSDGGVHSRYDQLLLCLQGMYVHLLQICLDLASEHCFMGLLLHGGVHSRYGQLLLCLQGGAENAQMH